MSAAAGTRPTDAQVAFTRLRGRLEGMRQVLLGEAKLRSLEGHEHIAVDLREAAGEPDGEHAPYFAPDANRIRTDVDPLWAMGMVKVYETANVQLHARIRELYNRNFELAVEVGTQREQCLALIREREAAQQALAPTMLPLISEEEDRALRKAAASASEPKSDFRFTRTSANGWTEVRMNVPYAETIEDVDVDGDEAKLKVAKFVISYSAGIATGIGLGDLARQLAAAWDLIWDYAVKRGGNQA